MQSDEVHRDPKAAGQSQLLESAVEERPSNVETGAPINNPDEAASIGLVKVRRLMLERVAHSSEHFCRYQQRGEPDLSVEDRLKICSELLDSNPGSFLTRFGSLLHKVDLVYFDRLMSDYMVNFRITELKRKLVDGADSCNRFLVKNRRFEAMRRLEISGEYFSDEEMKKRDPLLYEEMIGQFLTDEETANMSQKLMSENVQLSHLLLQHLQVMQNNEVYEQQVENQESQMEEDESDEEDTEEHVDQRHPIHNTGTKQLLSACEKAALRTEFIETMKERFLNGDDGDFDYSEVDLNTEYDSVDQLNRDAEDKYFDDDDDQYDDVIERQVNTTGWDY